MSVLSSKQDEERFEHVIQDKQPLLRSLARRILHNAADADDAVMNALMKAWTRRLLLRTPEKLAAWLCRIVVNESYSLLRKRKRERTVPLESSHDAPVLDDEANRLALERLEDAIARLPQPYRETVHIGMLSGLDTQTAAQILGCNANALYQRIHKAKAMLKEMLHDE